MGSKLKVIDKRLSPSPQAYSIPSKLVESHGKTFGLKLGSSVADGPKFKTPGPGQYS
jgi:hypothetical protein